MGVIDATDNLQLITSLKMPRIPLIRPTCFIDARKDDNELDLDLATIKRHYMVEICRCIQRGEQEEGIELSCILYFLLPHLSESQKQELEPVFTKEFIFWSVENFMLQPSMHHLLDQAPDYCFGYASRS